MYRVCLLLKTVRRSEVAYLDAIWYPMSSFIGKYESVLQGFCVSFSYIIFSSLGKSMTDIILFKLVITFRYEKVS